MNVQSAYAPAEGTRLYYEIAGNGPPLVLLHPGQTGRVYWDREFAEYAKSYRVVRYDARGYGRSERPDREYSLWEDLRCVLDAVGIDRAALVGVSLGGRTIIDFVLAFPERVSAMVLVNPGLSGYEFAGMRRYADAIRDANERDDIAANVELQLRIWVDGPARSSAEVDPSLRERLRELWTSQRARTQGRLPNPKFHELNAIARLGEISAPTLIVEADLDQPDIHTICDLLEHGIEGACRVRIPGAAHLVNLERPTEFDAAILPFLAALAR